MAGWATATEPAPAHRLDHGKLFRPLAQGGGDLILLSVDFSPDGRLIASAGGGHVGGSDRETQGEVKLWEVATGKLLRTWTVEGQIVFSVRFSPDGKLLAAASGPGSSAEKTPGQIHLWQVATGRLVRELQGHACGAYVVAFSPDGERLASGGISKIDPSKEGPVRGQHATGDVTLWNLRTGKAEWTREAHRGAVGSLVFAPDGKTLASGGGLFDGKVKLWQVADGTQRPALEFTAENSVPVAFDPKTGNLVVLCNNITGQEEAPPFTVQVSHWDTSRRQCVQSSTIKNGNVYRMALSHRGDLVACACHDGVKVYDMARQVEVRSLRSEQRMRPVTFSPNDEWLAAGSDDGTVKLWRVAELRE
jgi:WD40 repeat protein